MNLELRNLLEIWIWKFGFMIIGIDASRAFLGNRTGIEEYSYQVIKNLRDSLREERVVLYLRSNQIVDFDLPKNWKVNVIKWPRFWTQLGLSLEMLIHPVDALLIPAHTVPIIHPKNTLVVVHGLEYEFCSEAYSWLEKFYMRLTIRKSCKWANKIISVSENTKRDLMSLYNVPSKKVTVVYEGYEKNHQSPVTSHKSLALREKKSGQLPVTSDKFFLFIGRIETRKNIVNVIMAFELFKERYKNDYKLVFAGRPGYGFEKIKCQITNSKFKDDIIELGYISEEEKWNLLKNADAFIFATLYEGFGIPILEAQSVGCPVVASNNSSIPEVTNSSALLVDPNSPDEIAEKMKKLVLDQDFRDDIIKKGFKNVERFSWEKCAQQIANELKK
ncbi:MAG: glycosyl transferase, group 1 [uncultured bacterium]|nr:MAG: glycosyl transferase, group 1 [uncultured bacterium]